MKYLHKSFMHIVQSTICFLLYVYTIIQLEKPKPSLYYYLNNRPVEVQPWPILRWSQTSRSKAARFRDNHGQSLSKAARFRDNHGHPAAKLHDVRQCPFKPRMSAQADMAAASGFITQKRPAFAPVSGSFLLYLLRSSAWTKGCTRAWTARTVRRSAHTTPSYSSLSPMCTG